LKKSKELIKKIENFASIYQALHIKRQVLVTNRIKSMNESIYYNVDYIHSAIAQNKKISFKYFEYNINKTKKFRNNGNDYIVSPYALLWDNENYYLVASYNKHTDPITNFRVDKMEKVQIIDEPKDEIDDNVFNLSNYSNKIFGIRIY
jgi:predicted DNA-binding transcriptional regulator YafY